MVWSRNTVEALVIGIQSEFLEVPGLRLTLPQATRKFGLDRTTCGAILNALVETGVLTVTADGEFTRNIPPRINQTRREVIRFPRSPRRALEVGHATGTAA